MALIVSALAGLRLYYNDDRLKSRIEIIIAENTGGEARIGFLDIHDFLVIEIQDLELRNETNDSVWLSLSKITAAIDPLRLLRGELRMSEIAIESGRLNYAHLPAIDTSAAQAGEPSEGTVLPVALGVGKFHLSDFTISGPEAELSLDFILTDFNFSDLNNFSGTYSLTTDKGIVHYRNGDYSVAGIGDILAAGEISSGNVCDQRLKISLADITISAPQRIDVGELSLEAGSVIDLNHKRVGINKLRLASGSEEIIALTGEIVLEGEPRISLRADKKSWELSRLNSILKELEIPCSLSGILELAELEIRGGLSGISYQFTINLADTGIDYNREIILGGRRFHIFGWRGKPPDIRKLPDRGFGRGLFRTDPAFQRLRHFLGNRGRVGRLGGGFKRVDGSD
jgi:hypothetical protein